MESYINHLIQFEFLGQYSNEKEDQFEKFKSKILCTSWFNFNEKRKQAVEVISNKIDTGLKPDELNSIYRKIMNFRNALIHGEFKTNGTVAILEFYEGKFMEMELTDEKWDEMTGLYNQGISILRRTLHHLEILK
jgi:hypothetical protein